MSESPRIRVSCGGLCRIVLDGALLLEVNKNSGTHLTPIGGALEFAAAARPFLLRLGATFEKGNDLRLEIPSERQDEFAEWFAKRIDRETNPLRELREELLDEHGLEADWPQPAPACALLRTATEIKPTVREGREGIWTHYFHEVYHVELPAGLHEACRRHVQTGGRLRLCSLDALGRGEMPERELILGSSVTLLLAE